MLDVLGDVTFNNTAGVNSVVLRFLRFSPDLGDSFTVLKYLSANYLSVSAELPTLRTGLLWQELRNPMDLTYQVIMDPGAVPEPSTLILAAAALGALALIRRRSR